MIIRHMKKYFISGLLAILPLFGTIYVLISIYKLAVKTVEKIIPIKSIVNFFMVYNTKLAQAGSLVSFLVSLISILTIMVVIVILGFLVSGFFNMSKIKSLELLILKIPLAKSIYGTFKQLGDLIFSSDAKSYKKTVLVEYPRKGLFSMGLVTSESNPIVAKVLENDKLYNIFIPTSPNPTSGVFLIVPKEDVLELDIKIDDAFKMIISGGAIIPRESIEKFKEEKEYLNGKSE